MIKIFKYIYWLFLLKFNKIDMIVRKVVVYSCSSGYLL